MENCPVCGVGLSRTCKKCNSFNPSSAKFCFECGNELDNVKQDKLEKQQKVGVIFADISGFTSLAENYSPEETKGIINECFNIITEPVYRLDGYIDKYIGDCVMAVFGLENEHDVPLKTVECALTMRDKLNKYIKVRFAKQNISLNLSIGATYGDVILGSVGTKHDSDYTVIGDIVNVASRLQEQAHAGEILVNDQLHHETNKSIKYGELQHIKLKNKKELVSTYLAKAILDLHADLIYISKDETEIKSFIESNKNNQILQIIGEAGIGKTTIINKISKDYNSIVVSLSKAETLIPYIGLSKIIHYLINTNHNDDNMIINRKLELFIRFINSENNEEIILRNIDFLSLILKTDRRKEFEDIVKSMDYSDLVNEIKEQFDFFLHMANKDNNTILFIDDSENIDSKSLNVLTSLKEYGGKIILLSKNALLDNEKSLLLKLSNFTVPQSKEYIEKFFKTKISIDAYQNLYKLSTGNPLYLSELCRYIDNGNKKYKNNELFISSELLSDLPSSLAGIHSNIFNSLTSNLKEYLRVASTFFNEFDSKTIQQVLKQEYNEEIELSLVSLNIIEVYSYTRLKGRTYKKYIFQQQDFKSTIYNSLVNKEKLEYHRLIAGIYEIDKTEIENIIYHYEKAGDIKKEKEYVYDLARMYNAEFDLDQAILYYLKYLDLEQKLQRYSIESRVVESLIEVAKIKLYQSDFSEVIKHINDGLEIYQSDDELHRLQLLLIEYYKATANIKEILPILDELEKTLQKTSRNYGKLLQLQCTIYNMIGKPGVIEISDKSKDILLKAKDFDSLAETLTQAGIRYYIQGDISNGIAYLESALDYAKNSRNKALPTKIMTNLGILYNSHGEREKSHTYFKKAMKLSLEISNYRTYISSAINLGVSYLMSGKFENSKGVLEESVVLSKKSNLLYQHCISLTNLADVYFELGDFDNSMKLYQESKDLSVQMDLPIELSINELGIIKNTMKSSKLDDLEIVFSKLIKEFTESEEFSYVSNTYYEMSQYYLLKDELNKALDFIEKAIEFAEKCKSEADLIKAKRKKVELLYIKGEIDKTFILFDEVMDLSEKSNNYYELSKLYFSRYLYLDKELHNTSFLTKAEEISSYFDACYLTNLINNEINIISN